MSDPQHIQCYEHILNTMVKPTIEQQEALDGAISVQFKPEGTESNPLLITDIDEYPPLDENGYRRIDGFTARFEGVVPESWCSITGNMHGAAAAWLVDTYTSAMLMGLRTETFWGPPLIGGVSISIDMQYFHPCIAGSKIVVIGKVIKASTTLAHIIGEIRDARTNKLYSQGMHIKAWRPSSSRPNGKL